MNIDFVKKWFDRHPEYKNDVYKAYYAYHSKHPRLDEYAHDWPRYAAMYDGRNLIDPLTFENKEFSLVGLYDDKCMQCARSRNDVRWDSKPANCEKWKNLDIEQIIHLEEKKYLLLLDKSLPIIDKNIKKYGLSGKTLSMLHHTHGIDPEIVETFVERSYKEWIELKNDYALEYSKHELTGSSKNELKIHE